MSEKALRKRWTRKAAVTPTALPTALKAPRVPFTKARTAVPTALKAESALSRTPCQVTRLAPTSRPRAWMSPSTFSTARSQAATKICRTEAVLPPSSSTASRAE